MAIYTSFGQSVEPSMNLPSQVLIFMLRENYPTGDEFVQDLEGLGYSLDYSAKNISYVLFNGDETLPEIGIALEESLPLNSGDYAIFFADDFLKTMLGCGLYGLALCTAERGRNVWLGEFFIKKVEENEHRRNQTIC